MTMGHTSNRAKQIPITDRPVVVPIRKTLAADPHNSSFGLNLVAFIPNGGGRR